MEQGTHSVTISRKGLASVPTVPLGPRKLTWPRVGECCADRLATQQWLDSTFHDLVDPSITRDCAEACTAQPSSVLDVLAGLSDRHPDRTPVPRPVSELRHRPLHRRLLDLPDASTTRQSLERILQLHEKIRDLRVAQLLKEHGYVPPLHTPGDGLDVTKMEQVTLLARLPGLTLADLIRLVRGETGLDPRPNKALRPTDYRWLLSGYKHCDLMVQSATFGLQPKWLCDGPSQSSRPRNHKSAQQFSAAVARSVRTGQDGGQYLVVSDALLSEWPAVQVSPLGAVEKSGVSPEVEVRLIHDLKRPIGSSTNEATDKSTLPVLDYRPVAELAARIEALYARDSTARIRMMKGDVKGAFRHLMLHVLSVMWMGARLRDEGALLLELSAPFGWTSSPTYYGAYGGAITWLVQRESPASLTDDNPDTEQFFAYEWVDDHVLIECDKGDRLQLAATALRTAMMAVFGPRALNEKKFSAWESRLEVLGLEFDIDHRTISMPVRKIAKACARVQAMLEGERTTRSALMKLLGSLRHVCTCSRAVKPFFQRVQALCTRSPPNAAVRIPDDVRTDLVWTLDLLRSGMFRDLPMSMFAAWPEPDIHLYMDASNMGLAVLDPATNRYIQLRFDADELDLIAGVGSTSPFTINVREQLSVALAATVWGPTWRHRFRNTIGQVWCWVDNSTAVAVSNKLSSRNPMAQELNRGIGMAEALYGFRVRCIHLPGKMNVMADAASRAWAPPFTNMWLSLRQGWTKDVVPLTHRKLYATSSASCNSKAWRTALSRSTSAHGGSGMPGARHVRSPHGSPGTSPSTRNSSPCSPPTAGAGHPSVAATPPTPCCPRLALSRGIIEYTAATRPRSLGAALVGFFYLLRSSEYLSVNGGVASTALTRDDVTMRDSRGRTCTGEDPTTVRRVDLRLRGSKTDQEGRSVVLSLERSGSGWLCPVLAVLDLVMVAKDQELLPSAPLMTWSPGRVVRATSMIARLRVAGTACGIDPTRMGTHSLRSGGATAMMSAGVDLQAIKQFGRWSSDSVDRYTRLTAATTKVLAARMAERTPSSRDPDALPVGERPPRPPLSGRRCLGSPGLQ